MSVDEAQCLTKSRYKSIYRYNSEKCKFLLLQGQRFSSEIVQKNQQLDK